MSSSQNGAFCSGYTRMLPYMVPNQEWSEGILIDSDSVLLKDFGGLESSIF